MTVLSDWATQEWVRLLAAAWVGVAVGCWGCWLAGKIDKKRGRSDDGPITWVDYIGLTVVCVAFVFLAVLIIGIAYTEE